MKTKTDRKVNRFIRDFNKKLYNDVYKERFFLKQISKKRHKDYGFSIYELRFVDTECPSRNKALTYTNFEIIMAKPLIDMNDFIVESDFWKKHRKEA